MKNASLFLALLVGLFPGHADSGEKTITVLAVAETPDRCWCEYNVTSSKAPEEDIPYETEDIAPLRSNVERGEPDFTPTSDLPALSHDSLNAFSSKNLISNIIVYSIPLLPSWKPVADANTCGYCDSDTNALVSLKDIGVEEDLIYHVVHALQQHQNAFRKDGYNVKQPPFYAWERDEEIQTAK